MSPTRITRLTSLFLICAAFAVAGSARAGADIGNGKPQRKACTELKQEIAAKIEANGVRHFSLEIVAPDQLDGAVNVGRCDGGTRRIAYRRLSAPSEAIALGEAEPAAIEVLAVVPQAK
ncbi:DUF1161 domain-containing protein [Pseudomarimonas arenosa]|uniref:DUF1161 domain-containing protein n=1 Tax=Pseudomarimonas arenosa TaxID=2774145 RepID=A0AAW3ZTA4_9GAMM|nr:DUF1161 domain-containing protein [Pseudomarimonas arenosa]MBD8527759.1 DUF1161 domain-containing protein [Pseudomarimonas arenosa]